MKNKNIQYNPFSIDTDPIQFVFRVNAQLKATKYTWLSTNKVRPFPSVDIQRDYLYYFYAFSFSADIAILDYQAAIEVNDASDAGTEPDANTLPTFSTYLEGSANSPILRQPLGLPTYYDDVDFRKWRHPRTASTTGSTSNNISQITGEQVNNLKGSFTGSLIQTPNLIGKASINMIMTLFAQEINADNQSELLRGMK
jgi:hypothetical protein